jgi:hypothetical protein
MTIEELIEQHLSDPKHKRLVYVFAETEDGPCKIGMSIKPEQRLAQVRSDTKMRDLQIWWLIKHDNASCLEMNAHSVLFQKGLKPFNGKEWFFVSVQEAIEAINKAAEKTTVLKEFWLANPHFIDGTYVRPKPVMPSGENHWARRAYNARMAKLQAACLNPATTNA